MNYVRIGVLTLLSAFAVAACTQQVDAGDPRFIGENAEFLNVVIDEDTNCKYVIFSNVRISEAVGGITPLLKSDGSADCD